MTEPLSAPSRELVALIGGIRERAGLPAFEDAYVDYLLAIEAAVRAPLLIRIEALEEALRDVARQELLVRPVLDDWRRRGLLRFNSRDDGSDDLILANLIAKALAAGAPR